jgi:LysM repeat protein
MVRMNFIERVKHLPRWSWYTAAGVSAGALALKLYKNRAAPDAVAQASSGDTVADGATGSVQPATSGGSPPGVIVPPVIMPSDGGTAGDIAGALSGLLGGVVDNMTGLVGGVVSGEQVNQGVLLGILGSQSDIAGQVLLANAGPPPVPVQVNPTPVIVQMPPPAKPPVAHPPPKPKGPTPKPTTKNYTVRKGDTLSDIARKYGTSVSWLASHNGITNPNKIRVGQVIKVPA